MFWKKSQKKENSDEAVAKRGIKKMDAIVTGAILGGVVASLYGVKKIRENQNAEKNSENFLENNSVSEKKKSGFFKFFSKK